MQIPSTKPCSLSQRSRAKPWELGYQSQTTLGMTYNNRTVDNFRALLIVMLLFWGSINVSHKACLAPPKFSSTYCSNSVASSLDNTCTCYVGKEQSILYESIFCEAVSSSLQSTRYYIYRLICRCMICEGGLLL